VLLNDDDECGGVDVDRCRNRKRNDTDNNEDDDEDVVLPVERILLPRHHPMNNKAMTNKSTPDLHDRNNTNEDYNTTKGEDMTATITAPLDGTGHSDSNKNNNAGIIFEIACIEASMKNKKINDSKEVVMGERISTI
jgi:hypothetical protein